jgi:hypothetical protein
MKITSTKKPTYNFIFAGILESDPLYPALRADLEGLIQSGALKAEIVLNKDEYAGDVEGELTVDAWISKKSIPQVEQLFSEILEKHGGEGGLDVVQI